MISAIHGELKSVLDDRVEISAGAFSIELLVPTADVDQLRSMIGRSVTLHAYFYLQGDGNVFDPVLVGFLNRTDKKFFELFITVKGIGPRTAIRALSIPVPQIAAAIESKDARSLTKLKGIGKRTAEMIVAELAGKCGEFCGEMVPDESEARPPKSSVEEDAIVALVSLGERRIDAEALLARARRTLPNTQSVDELVTEMLRQRGSR